MTRSKRGGYVLAAALISLILVVLYDLATDAHAAKRQCQTITKCRTSIAWNHSVIVDLNARLAIANDVKAGGGRSIVCHTLPSCQRLQRAQQSSRIWAEGAWLRLQHDFSPNGLHRITRYLFHPCGAVAVSRAISVEGWESAFVNTEQNGALDTGPWQYELPAHPDISYSQAIDGWWSTMRAVRDTDCGVVWSPMWSSVRDHGYWWVSL